MKNKILIVTFSLLGIVAFAQFPAGGYQGGGHGSGGDQTLDVVVVDLKAYLQGAWDTTDHTTALNDLGLLPLEQPYDTSKSTFWLHTGTESVASIPHDSVTDWILVELRETSGGASDAKKASAVAMRAGFILSNGRITDLDGFSELRFKYLTISNNLFPVIYHRNHLAIMSASSPSLTDEVYSYDFTSSSAASYTDAGFPNPPVTQLATGKYGMWAGEVRQDNFVNNINYLNTGWDDRTELLFFLAYPAQIVDGYHFEDVNMDGKVRFSGKRNDRNLIWQNAQLGGSLKEIIGHVPW